MANVTKLAKIPRGLTKGQVRNALKTITKSPPEKQTHQALLEALVNYPNEVNRFHMYLLEIGDDTE